MTREQHEEFITSLEKESKAFVRLNISIGFLYYVIGALVVLIMTSSTERLITTSSIKGLIIYGMGTIIGALCKNIVNECKQSMLNVETLKKINKELTQIDNLNKGDWS